MDMPDEEKFGVYPVPESGLAAHYSPVEVESPRFRVIAYKDGWVVEKRVGGSLPAIWNLAEPNVWNNREDADRRRWELEAGRAARVSAGDPENATRDPWVPFEQPVPLPIEPAPGTVLGFTKRYHEDGPAYSFAAIHVARLGWYLTGPKYAGHPVQWDTLLDFIGEPADWARVGVVTGWTPLVGA